MFISYNQIKKKHKKPKGKKIKLKNMSKYLGTELVNLVKQFSVNVTNTVNNFFSN